MPKRHRWALLLATCTWGSLFGQSINLQVGPLPSEVVTVENRSGQPWRLQLAAEAFSAHHRYRIARTSGAEQDLTLSVAQGPQAAMAIEDERFVTLPAHGQGQPYSLRFPAGQWPGPIEMRLKDHRGVVDCRLLFTASRSHQGTQVVSVELLPDWGEAEAVAVVVQAPSPSAVVIREGQFRSSDPPAVHKPRPKPDRNNQIQPRKLFF